MDAALIVFAIVVFLLLLFAFAAIKVAREYERGIVFRLGRLLPEPKGPGLFILIPIVDRMVRVDLRTITLNIPPQEVITKDNVPVRVNAVAYFRIVKPEDAIVQVENFMVATSQIAQTTLRSVLGQHQLDELLSEREKINAILQGIIDEQTAPWGIKVSIVEVKDVEIPQGMQRAMARQAEAERERRAKVINAEGEFQASERLKDAAKVIEEHPIALQLRYLQTLLELGAVAVDDDRLPDPDRDAAGRSPPSATSPLPDERRALADLRHDATTGRWVAIAPARARAARARGRSPPTTPATCPFCAGHEDRTPPETLRLGDGPTGWQVRVVPNLYPALERQEVVIHGPTHVHSFGELWTTRRSTSSPRRGSGGRATPAATASRSSTRATRPARRCRTRTRSSPGCPRPAPAVVAERGLPAVLEVARARRRHGRLPGREPRPVRAR